MDGSPMDHPCKAKASLDRLSKIDHDDADGKESKLMPSVNTIGTMPSLSDLPPTLSDLPPIAEFDEYERVLSFERSSDEGRRCDITYTYCCDDMSDASRSGFNDPLLCLWHPDPLDPKKCSTPGGLNQNTVCNEVGKVQKRVWKFGPRSSGDEEGITGLLCNRRLQMVKIKQDDKEKLELQSLAEVSIMTQIAQHADQAQGLITPSLKGFGTLASAGSSFGRKVFAPAGDLNFDHSSGRQVTTAFSTRSKSPSSKRRPVDLSVPDEAVEMDELAEFPAAG